MMENEEKKVIDWSILDTTILYMQEEIVAYYLYIGEKAKKKKRAKELNNCLLYLGSYAKKKSEEEVEVNRCSMK